MTSLKQEKVQTLSDLYQEEDFIDAKDNQGDWRVGFIINKNELTKTFKVRFDGWAAKYDETYKFGSPKLKPFRSLVVGYTGQKQNPAIREGWKLSRQDLQARLIKMRIFFEQASKYSIHDINQILRGHNYMYTDFLMTNKLESVQIVGPIIDYFLMNIRFLVEYLKQIESDFDKYLEAIQDPSDIVNLSSKDLLRKSYYEIFDIGYIISGSYTRLASFFKDNGELLKEYWKNSKQKDAKKVYQSQIVTTFVQLQGFEIINSIIQKMLQAKRVIPFLFLHSFTHLFSAFSSILNSLDRETFIERLIAIGAKNMQAMREQDFKQLHKHHVTNFVDALVALSQKTGLQGKCEEWAIGTQLQLCLKMITCPYFDKKLKGVSQILFVCEKKSIILQNKFLIDWMEKVKLFQVLFLNNDNPEFIKKSAQLAKFLFIKHNLSLQNIDLIWKSRIGKHQTVLKQIYNLYAEFPLYENDAKINLALFQRVAAIQQKDWDEDYIKLVREFSENAMGIQIKQKLTQIYGFDIIYKYCLLSQTQFAVSELVHYLRRCQKSDFFVDFQNKCFLAIQSAQQVQIHLRILLVLSQERIDSFEKVEAPMIPILIQYLTDISNDEKHIVNVGEAFELLSEVVRISRKEVSLDSLRGLWDHFTHSKSREKFMKWLYKKKDNGRVLLSHCIGQEHRRSLLTELWPEDKPQILESVDEDEATFFVQLFKSTNVLVEKMRRINLLVKPTTFGLEGYSKLWHLFLRVQNQKVVRILGDFIAEIHTSFEEDQMQESIQNLVEEIVKNIKEAVQVKNSNLSSRLLLLTKSVTLRDQQIFPISQVPKVNFIKQYTILHKQKGEEKIIRYNCMGNFYEFKKIVADRFGIPLHFCQLYNHKHEIVKIESYFKSLIQNQFTNKFQLVEDRQKHSQVKFALNKRLDLFFELLGDVNIQKLVWSIVSKLPISIDLKLKIIQTKDVLGQLKQVGFYKQLYMLKVMLELDDEWWQNFSTSENLELLVDGYGKVALKSDIEEQYLSTLTEIIGKMLTIHEGSLKIPNNFLLSNIQVLRTLLGNIQKDGVRSLDLETKIIKNIFLIGQKVKNQQNTIHALLSYQNREELLVSGLIGIKNSHIRKAFNQNLKHLLPNIGLEDEITFLRLLLNNLLALVIGATRDKQHFKQYFQFTSYFLSNLEKKRLRSFLQLEEVGLASRIFALAQGQPQEKTNQNINIVLIGYLSLLRHLAPFEPIEKQETIVHYVIYNCLFSNENSKCKTRISRSAALNLLKSLMIPEKIVVEVCQFLTQLHRGGKWRTRRLDDWTITVMDKMKSATGYVGLKNLGCICYMNSFFQQMFMIPDFRKSILVCQDPNFDPENEQDDVLFQIQKMFLNLQFSEKKFYNPKDFCNAFKDYDGNPTNVTQQMDIDEFSGILFDRLQSQMKPTGFNTLVSDLFGGVFSNEIICKGCPHFSESEQNFLSISLTVKGKKNIYQSLDNMIKGDTLDGDNAYFCERCNKKVTAVKRVSLKKLPNNLIITLKRFQFDYQTMTKLKVNDYCQFPINLNIKEYSRQFLRKQESSKAIQEEQIYSNDYYSYVLKGVVVHMGYADSGHYYSFVQQRNGKKWLQFNDTIVRDFNIDDLAEQAFGGETSGFEAKQKIKNAYMLIYQRQKKIKEGPQIHILDNQIVKKPVYAETIYSIICENKEQKIQTILFSHEYCRFVSGLIEEIDFYPQNLQKIVFKYIFTVYLTVNLREKSDALAFALLRRLHPTIRASPELIEWVLSLFCEQKIFQEFFRNNFNREVKKLLSYFLIDLFPLASGATQRYFSNLLLNKLVEQNQNVLEYCLILYELSANGSLLDYLVEQNVVGRLMQNLVKRDIRLFVEKLQVLPMKEVSQIGNEIVIERTQRELDRKLKIDNQNGYLWGIINRIVRRANEKILPLQSYLTKVQADYLQLPQSKIYKILEQLRTKTQMYQFISFLGWLSFESKDNLVQLMNQVCSGLKEFQSKRYRQFFLLFEKLIQIQDKYKTVRLQFFKKVLEALVHNQQYSLDSNIIQQWIIILLNRNSALRKYLLLEKQHLQYLHNLANKKYPSDDVARKNNSYGQFMINKLHGVKFPRSKKGYVRLAKEMEDFYEQILEDRFVQSPLWPSVHDTEQKELVVGDAVAYFDTKEKIDYEEGKVEGIFLGRLELSFKQKRINVWKDDQKLSLDVKYARGEEEAELNSSRTTEMDADEEVELFDDI